MRYVFVVCVLTYVWVLSLTTHLRIPRGAGQFIDSPISIIARGPLPPPPFVLCRSFVHRNDRVLISVTLTLYFIHYTLDVPCQRSLDYSNESSNPDKEIYTGEHPQ